MYIVIAQINLSITFKLEFSRLYVYIDLCFVDSPEVSQENKFPVCMYLHM